MSEVENSKQTAGLSAVTRAHEEALQSMARKAHGLLAELSHKTRLAADKLDEDVIGQGIGICEIRTETLQSIISVLRDVQNHGHARFLKQHGSEVDYQAIGRKVEKELPPIWRKQRPKRR